MSEDRADELAQLRRELLGQVPYLLRYHPADSVVAVFAGADRYIRVAARTDLAAPPAMVIAQWTAAARRVGAASAVVIGYGPRTAAVRVTAVADGLAAQVPVADVLLVTGGQFFCLRCPCPAAAGVRFDPAATIVAARLTMAGEVALASREDLLALAEPDPAGQAAVSAVLAEVSGDADSPAVLRYLMEQAADGHRLTAADMAWLARMLREPAVRDLAVRATGTVMWQRDLWLDATRRMPAGYVAAPASLAGWCAWRRGEELLAVTACRRALADDPGYLFARLILHAIVSGVPPQALLAGRPHSTTPAGGELL